MIKDNILRGDENVYVPAHLNFGKTIFDRLRSMGHEVAIENAETGETLTYKQVTQYAVDLSVSLTKLGIRRGDVVALGSEKRIMILPSIIGVIMTGATYTPYDYEIGRAVLHHAMSIAKPKFLIYSEKFWNKFSEVIENFHIEFFISLDNIPPTVSVKSLTPEHYDVTKFEPAEVQGQVDVALILYSSGTTGLPKGVMLTHLNCYLQFITHNIDDENILTTGEWYHSYDICVSFGILLSGRKLVYINNPNVDIIMKSIEGSQVNSAYLVPSLLNWMVATKDNGGKCNLESLKILYSTGATLSTETIAKLKQRFVSLRYVIQIYGCTEAASVCVSSKDQMFRKPQSVGNVLPGLTVKIINPETEEILGPNQNGEICCKGPVLMKGYVGVIDSSIYLDKEGFYKSGDFGYYDEDGSVFIVGRLKEIIKYDGYPVPPVQLEHVLLQHPAVLEAGVVGKPVPDVEELPTAFVVKRPGVNVTEQELIDYVAKEVSHYMQLRGGVIFVAELPKTPKGKLLRRCLKEMLNRPAILS